MGLLIIAEAPYLMGILTLSDSQKQQIIFRAAELRKAYKTYELTMEVSRHFLVEISLEKNKKVRDQMSGSKADKNLIQEASDEIIKRSAYSKPQEQAALVAALKRHLNMPQDEDLTRQKFQILLKNLELDMVFGESIGWMYTADDGVVENNTLTLHKVDWSPLAADEALLYKHPWQRSEIAAMVFATFTAGCCIATFATPQCTGTELAIALFILGASILLFAKMVAQHKDGQALMSRLGSESHAAVLNEIDDIRKKAVNSGEPTRKLSIIDRNNSASNHQSNDNQDLIQSLTKPNILAPM